MLDYVLSDGISHNLITTDSSEIRGILILSSLGIVLFVLSANASKELTSHIMKAKLYEIIVIRLLQRI